METDEGVPTREKLVTAARNVFAAKGYQGATTRTIAEEAGMSEMTLFRYFPTKRELFKAVLEQYSSLNLFDQDFINGLTWDLKQDLRMIASIFFAMARHNTTAMLTSIIEATRNPELRELIGTAPRKQREFLAWYLNEQKKKRGCKKKMDAHLAAQAFFAMFFEYSISLLIYENGTIPSEKIVEQLVELYMEGIA